MTVDVETDGVDWLAVEFVCNGTPMSLGDDPATLRAAVLAVGYRSTPWQIAERLGTNTRRVMRILEKAGGVCCLLCSRRVICDDGVLPWHVKGDGNPCRMAGFRADDVERCRLIRATEKKVAGLG